jgi:hypothetical protein
LFQARIEDELRQLLVDIRRIGGGSDNVSFGKLFDDDEAQNYYEALVGTLKCAKKRGVVEFKGQMLLKGVHDKIVITITDSGKESEKNAPKLIETAETAEESD